MKRKKTQPKPDMSEIYFISCFYNSYYGLECFEYLNRRRENSLQSEHPSWVPGNRINHW